MSENKKHTVLPRPLQINGKSVILAPTEDLFISQFGAHLPAAQYLPSTYGITAFYDLPPSVNSPATHVQNILFIHGLGTCALGLLPLANAVRTANPHAHVILYDNWGHGLSSTPLVPHVPGLFHFQILLVLAKIGWTKAHVIGYSFGGATAASFAALHPQHVESVTLLAPAGLFRLSDFTAEQQIFIRGGEGVDEQEAAHWMVDFASGGPLVVADDWKERFAQGEIFSGDPIQAWERAEHKGHLASFVSIFRDGGIYESQDLFARAAKSGIPNLAVIGELDDVCSEEALKAVGWKDVVVIKLGKHSLVRDNVTEVAAPIERFLKGLALASQLGEVNLKES